MRTFMKHSLHFGQIVCLGLFMMVPLTLSASNSGKTLNFAIQTRTKQLNTDSSGTTFKITEDQDSSTADAPKIQFSDPFPNPASTFVKINYQFPSAGDNGELKIMDLTGKTVMTYPLNGSGNTLRINVSDLTRGLYFFTIYYKGQLIKSNKLIVSNQH